MTSTMRTVFSLTVLCWDRLSGISTGLLHVVAVIVYVQILNAIPKPLYLVHRLGEWATTPPRPVDLEVVPYMPAFKPSTLSPADVLFILAGCTFVLVSFVRLVTRSHTLIGSSFLIPLAILCSTGLSFILSLRIAMALNISVHPTSLSHALPFLIAIIGFEKPLRVAQVVFQTSPACTLVHHNRRGPPIPILLIASFLSVLPLIVRDYFIEIKILVLAAYLPFGCLRQLCAFAALTLAVHYFVFSYFLLVLTLIVRISVIRMTNDIKATLINSTPPIKPPYLPLSSLLGEKGTSLYNPKYSFEDKILCIATDSPDPEKESGKNPALRLKLLIFTSFLLFNLVTPLTPFALSHHPLNKSTSISNTHRTIPDISSPPISSMLNALAVPDPAGAGKDLHIKLYPTTPTTPTSSSPLFSANISLSFNRFMLSLSLDLDSLILPDHTVLSYSFLAIIALLVILSASLTVFQAIAEIGTTGLMKFLFGIGGNEILMGYVDREKVAKE